MTEECSHARVIDSLAFFTSGQCATRELISCVEGNLVYFFNKAVNDLLGSNRRGLLLSANL